MSTDTEREATVLALGATSDVKLTRARLRDPMQWLAVLIVFVTPLVPRPTFVGPTRYVAPALVVLLLCLAVLHAMSSQRGRRHSVLNSAVFAVMLASTVMYGARVIWNGERGEVNFVISRVMFVVMIVACCSLLTGVAMDRAIRWFALGAIPLALLVALIAVTGLHILEAPRPGRTLGITFPWHKTAGVPRSFGEQGIIISMTLAYCLVYWGRLGRFLKVALPMASLILFAAGQSRNIFLGTFAVLAMWLFIVKPRRLGSARLALVASGAAVLVMQQVLPYLSNTSFGRDVVGQGIFERNVESRFTLFNGALKMINNSPLRSILGWSHDDWRNSNLLQVDAGVHNFFASSLLFLGLIGGFLTLWGLFVRPLGHALALFKNESLAESRQLRVKYVLTAGTGVLVSLNFYEGFFSLAVALYVAFTWQLLLNRDGEVGDEPSVTNRLGRSAVR